MDFIEFGFDIFNFKCFKDIIFERIHFDFNCYRRNLEIENLDEFNPIFEYMTHSDQDNFSNAAFSDYFQN